MTRSRAGDRPVRPLKGDSIHLPAAAGGEPSTGG